MSEPEPQSLLRPTVVGDIAHGRLRTSLLTVGEVAELGSQGLAFAAAKSIASADPTQQTTAERKLSGLARAEALRSMVTAASASQVAEILRADGIRALIYKGPGLAALTTGSWLGRGSSDVDVLISPSDTARAHTALAAAGLRRVDGEPGPPSRGLKFRQCERAYCGLEVHVDLHWRVEANPGNFSVPFDDLWRRRWDFADSGIRFSTAGELDALLITAVHGARERYWKWRWVLDAVRQVEAAKAPEWLLATRLGRASGSSTALAICATVASLAGAGPTSDSRADERHRERSHRWLELDHHAATSRGLRAALNRKLDSWNVGDSRLPAADGLLRAVARQIAPDGEKAAHRVQIRM